jgi:uncharacterized RDD family membrane protein YckC
MFQAYAEPPYAGFWIRFLAYLIDSILLSLVFCPLGLGIGFAAASAGIDPNSPEMTLGNFFTNVLSIFAGWLYFALTESSSWQATIGKKLVNLKVTDMYGQRLTFGRATGRYFGKILSSLICLIGFIMAAFTDKKQALHDMMASTLVVKDIPPLYDPPPPPQFGYGDGGFTR